MKIFYGFLIIVTVSILFMLPITEGIYDFRTDVRDDNFYGIETGVGVTTSNVTLHTNIYDDDTETIDILSDESTDIPAYSAYDTGTRVLTVSGLAASGNRTLTVSYDIDALSASAAVSNFMDVVSWIWFILLVAFPAAAIAAIFMGRAG